MILSIFWTTGPMLAKRQLLLHQRLLHQVSNKLKLYPMSHTNYTLSDQKETHFLFKKIPKNVFFRMLHFLDEFFREIFDPKYH